MLRSVLLIIVLAFATVANAQLPVNEDFSDFGNLNTLIEATKGDLINRDWNNACCGGLYADTNENLYRINGIVGNTFSMEFTVWPHSNFRGQYVELLASADASSIDGSLSSPGSIRLELSTQIGAAADDFSWNVADGAGADGTATTYDVGYENVGLNPPGSVTKETGQMIRAIVTGNLMTIDSKEVQDASWTNVVTNADVTGRAASGYVNFGFNSLRGSGGNAGTYDDLVYTETVTPALPATVFTWNVNASGDWNLADNWTKVGSGTVPNDANHTAIFGSVITSPHTAFTDTDVSVNRIEFSNTDHSYAISSHGSVNLFATTDPNSPVNPSMSVEGTHLFQAAVNLHAPTTANVASGSVLTFDGALNLSGTTLTKTGDGTLAINNRVTLGGGSVINAQGVMSGVGSIGGDVVNDGTISPGNSQAANGSAPGQVPEPGALVLLLIGTLAWTWQSSHRGKKD